MCDSRLCLIDHSFDLGIESVCYNPWAVISLESRLCSLVLNIARLSSGELHGPVSDNVMQPMRVPQASRIDKASSIGGASQRMRRVQVASARMPLTLPGGVLASPGALAGPSPVPPACIHPSRPLSGFVLQLASQIFPVLLSQVHLRHLSHPS